MNPNSMEANNNYPTKEESRNTSHHDTNTSRASSSSNNPTPWLKSKDPRIVRVSRALGTKDRHSKVCTVRGLRDRRVRLSVPTAIQLYDLQDRLGLNQPSKVFDWLIDASKEAIDDLPPLQMPQGLNHHMINPSNEIDWEDQTGLARLNLWNSSNVSRSRSKEIVGETSMNEEEKHQVSSSTNFFPRNINHNNNNSTSLQGLLNSMLPYGGSYYQLEPSSNFNFSQLGGHHGIMPSSSHHGQGDQHHQQQELQNFNVLVCPPQGTSTTQTYFPEFDPRQMSHFHMLSSTTSSSPSQNPFTTFQLGMNPNNRMDESRNEAPNKDT